MAYQIKLARTLGRVIEKRRHAQMQISEAMSEQPIFEVIQIYKWTRERKKWHDAYVKLDIGRTTIEI